MHNDVWHYRNNEADRCHDLIDFILKQYNAHPRYYNRSSLK